MERGIKYKTMCKAHDNNNKWQKKTELLNNITRQMHMTN